MPDEDKWSGPIERLIRSFALTVVLPATAMAEAFLEENHLGERLAFICPAPKQGAKLHDDSAVAKLALRPELDAGGNHGCVTLNERFPHICIAERDANFNKIKNALTLEVWSRPEVLRKRTIRFSCWMRVSGFADGALIKTENSGRSIEQMEGRS